MQKAGLKVWYTSERGAKMPDCRTDVEKMAEINRILETMSPVYDDENPDCFLAGLYYDKSNDKLFFRCGEE